ncbi:hypothetical protein OG417_06010 [Actinoallomurus sp. NBC_01490]|uniref:hypothetical protein n=1 Tax=Actinoallomurus sp. NBC_01490 TaxID=2903557 RepID=UPI002E32DE0C|nr:hypothetical protein [Actinoallomurus sp. NBC_01490]
MILDSEEVAAQPELAMLGVMAHGRNRKVVQTFTDTLKAMEDSEHALQYYEHAYLMASPAGRRILEEFMPSTDWPVYSPFAKKHYGRGKAEGLEEGEVKGEVKSILAILDAREIEVPEDARARIRGCVDVEQLDTWLKRAAVAHSVTDVFD